MLHIGVSVYKLFLYIISGVLLYVGLGGSEKQRLGGSAVAQCYQQIGDDSPDMDDPQLFVKGFNITQELIQGRIKVLFNLDCSAKIYFYYNRHH